MRYAKKHLFVDQSHWESSLDKVVLLGTTMGNQIPVPDAERRLARLGGNEWKRMIDNGAQAFQYVYDGSHSAALDVVNTVLQRFGERAAALELREQMEKKKTPPEAIDKVGIVKLLLPLTLLTYYSPVYQIIAG